MNLEEAIKHLEETLEDSTHIWSCENCKEEHKQLLTWLLKLRSLRTQREVKNNAPLTPDEMWEMAQKCEGIYIARVDGTPVFRGQKYCAAVLDFSPAFGSAALHVHAIYGDRLTLWEDDYGKTWLAYRRKPEEEV